MGIMLLQGLVIMAAEGPKKGDLSRSNEGLRNSRDNVPRSQSQELKKDTATFIAGMPYLDSPCGGWMSNHFQNNLKPYVFNPDYFPH